MNIIAVDDEPHALRSIARAVKSVISGSNPVLFSTPEEALGYAKTNRVEIAFLDIEMSGMNGLVLAKCLKDTHNNTNVIFVTGYSQYALDAYTLYPTGYLMKPVTEENLRSVMENLRHPVEFKSGKRMCVQTFGNFEVFAEGIPLHFPRAKAKEVLAYLVHKNGTSSTMQELAAVLEEGSAKNIRTYVSSMIKTMEDAGLSGVIVKNYNKIAVDTSKFDCDLYRFLKMDAEAVNSYAGEYMASYSWAEFTAGFLDRKV